jgi:hypothetical protein
VSFRVERRDEVVRTELLFVPCAVDVAASFPPESSCNVVVFVPWRFGPRTRLARPRSVAEPGPMSLGANGSGKLGLSPASSVELCGSSSVAGDCRRGAVPATALPNRLVGCPPMILSKLVRGPLRRVRKFLPIPPRCSIVRR